MDEFTEGSNPIDKVDLPFADRRAAGRALAGALAAWRGREDVLILALSRGGAAVAREVAAALGAALDLFPVGIITAPGRGNLSLGAVTVEGDPVWNEALRRRLGGSEAAVQAARRAAAGLAACRGGRPPPSVREHGVILVDDGLVSGACICAAALAVRRQQPAWIAAAVPVAPPEAAARLCNEVDELICLAEPEPFHGISDWYLDYSPVSDEEVTQWIVTSHKPQATS